MRNGGCGEHRGIGACSCGGQKRWCRGCLCSSPKKWGLERLIPVCQLISCCILLPEGCGVCPSAEPRSGAPAAPRAQRAAPISWRVSSQIKPSRKPPSPGLSEGLAGLCVGQHLGELDLGAGQGRGVPPSPPGERPRATSPRTGGGSSFRGYLGSEEVLSRDLPYRGAGCCLSSRAFSAPGLLSVTSLLRNSRRQEEMGASVPGPCRRARGFGCGGGDLACNYRASGLAGLKV